MAIRIWMMVFVCFGFLSRSEQIFAFRGAEQENYTSTLHHLPRDRQGPSHVSDISDAPPAFDTDTVGGAARMDSTRNMSDWRLFSGTFTGMIAQAIFRGSNDTLKDYRVVNENRQLEPFAGRTIRHIYIHRRPPFDPPGNRFQGVANNVHILTRENAIRRDLLIRSGDRLKPDAVVKNMQLLRSRGHIAQAQIEVVPDPVDSMVVDLLLCTQDKWSIGLDGDLNINGPSTINLYDANLFGRGNRLTVSASFDWRHGGFGGNQVEYEIQNLWGTFYEAYLVAGKRFERSNLGIRVRKEFILPHDYMLGATYMREAVPTYMIFLDSTFRVQRNYADLWAGYSIALPGWIRSSLYFTGRYVNREFSLRPHVEAHYNPAFHNADLVLGGIGLYREHFYTANLVYGYGIREYLAAGYRAELNAGYEWGEFENSWYFGAHYSVGGFSRGGAYWTGGFTLGSYIDPRSGKWHNSGVDFDGRYFSRLFRSRRTLIRQFIRTNYTQGWNRYTGNDEVIMFTQERGPLGIREHVFGTNRLNLNSETVYFTPWKPYGFQVALFHFLDVSLLGNKPFIFDNDFFSTIGLGIRIKNERLAFSALQIRLGIALGKSGLLKSEYLRFSSQPRVDQFRFLPSQPEVVLFR